MVQDIGLGRFQLLKLGSEGGGCCSKLERPSHLGCSINHHKGSESLEAAVARQRREAARSLARGVFVVAGGESVHSTS